MLRILRCFFWAALALAAAGSLSSQELRYGYDELGRLIEVVEGASRVTRYSYDPAGNLLRVTVDGTLQPPVIDGEVIDQFRCGVPVTFEISGTGLESAQVTTSDPHLTISDLQHHNGVLSFTMFADCTAPPGQYQLVLTTPSGTIELDVSVDPLLPVVMVLPVPLAVPPDGSERAFVVRLTNIDTIDHVFDVSVAETDIAQVTVATLTIEAGNLQATGGLRGISAGHTVLRLESATLGDWVLPIFVTADFAGVNTSVGNPIGVLRETDPETVPPAETGIEGAHVGLVMGPYLSHLDPSAVAIDSENIVLEIHGAGFEPGGSVVVDPDDGLVVGEPVFEPSGERISLLMSVEPEAPMTVRRVVVRDAEGTRIPASDPHADRLHVVAQMPQLYSVEPMNVVPGDTGLTLTLRGANLSGLMAIEVNPPEGITLGGAPDINDEGTVVRTGLTVSPDAPYGPRVITVVTPGGRSPGAPSPSNTLHVAPLIEDEIPALAGALVGVVRESAPEEGERALHADSPMVGLVKGPVLERLEPAAIAVGETEILTLVGSGLDAVDAIVFSPDDGVQVQGAPLPGAGGESVSVPVAVDDGAPLGYRQVRVFIEGEPVHPVSPDADRLRVTPGAPVLHSVTPRNLLADGEVRELEIRGLRLDNASRVELVPPDHIAVGSLTVSDDGSLVSVRVDVSPGAATGARLVRVHTPGGITGTDPEPANTVYVVEEIDVSVPSLVGTSVGVVREVEFFPEPTEHSVHSDGVGVVREFLPQPGETAHASEALPVGVARGAVAESLSTDALRPGETVLLEISGVGLAGVSQVSFEPEENITVDSVDAQGDGRAVSVSVSVTPGAEPGVRRVRLFHAGGEVVFSNPGHAALHVARDAPSILSIEPILAGQGDVITLLIRGERLHDASHVFAEPAEGLRFGNAVSVNAEGTELTVPVSVDPDASLGSRVIRVLVPGWETGPAPEPANTFTVYESVP